jgi:PST family polysaccharide transporter
MRRLAAVLPARLGGGTEGGRSLAAVLVGGGIWALGGKAVGGVLGLGITAVLARLMAPAELGIYLLAFSLVVTAATLARLGLEQVGLRLVAEHLGRQEDAAAAAVAWRVLALVGLAGLALGVLAGIWPGPWLAEAAFGSVALASVLPVSAAWLVAFTIQLTLAELFRGARDIRLASLMGGTVFGGLLSTCLIGLLVAVAWALGIGLDAERALLLSLAGTVGATLPGFWLLARRLPPPGRVPGLPGHRRLLRLGLPLLVAQFSLLVMLQADLWILALFRPESEVALYGAASRVVKFLALLAVVNDVTAPEIARLNVRGDRSRLEQLLQVSATCAALPCVMALAVLAAAPAGLLELLYGSYYREAWAVLLILGVRTAVTVLVGSAPYVLVMTGHGAARMAVSLGGTAAMLALGLALTPAFGMTGLAVAVAAAGALQQIAAWAAVRRCCGVWTHADPVRTAATLRTLLARAMKPPPHAA